MVNHPGVSAIDCDDCQRRLYDLRTGKPKTYTAGPNREIRYFDGPNHKPPCRTSAGCPKGTPETRHETELTRRNVRAWESWRRARAVGFATGGMDALTAEAFALIDQVIEASERGRRESLVCELIRGR